MIKTISKIALMGLTAAVITGCGGEAPKPVAPVAPAAPSFACKQENVLAPKWTCIPDVPGYYAGVGIADKHPAGVAHMRKVAVMNGRSDLAQQIQTTVKDKMAGFTQATGTGDAGTVDSVSKSITSQVAKINLKGSKAMDMWTAPSGAIYMLVTVPEDVVNGVVKKAAKTSFNNDDARWQQFQGSEAFKELEKEFN